jgi:hypothetical protein
MESLTPKNKNTNEPPKNTNEPPKNTNEPPKNTNEPPKNTNEPPKNTNEPPKNTNEPPKVIFYGQRNTGRSELYPVMRHVFGDYFYQPVVKK